MAKLSLTSFCCSIFLSINVLAQDQPIEALFNSPDQPQEIIQELQTLSGNILGRAIYPDVPGIDGGMPTDSEFQDIDAKFEDAREEVNTYLAKPMDEFEDHSTMIINKVKFIITTFRISFVILTSKIYSGLSLNELDTDQYRITVPRSSYNEMLQGIELSITPQAGNLYSYDKDGLFMMEEDNENIILKINPAELAELKMEVDTSKDTDEAFSKLVKYPIIQLYFDSILNSQKFRGVENPTMPDIAPLAQSDYETTMLLLSEIWQKTLEAERKEIFTEAVYKAIIKIMFTGLPPIPEEYRLTTDLSFDQFLNDRVESDWQDMIFANSSYINTFNSLNTPKLKEHISVETLQMAEFFAFDMSIRNQIESWPSDLSCASIEECLNDENLRFALANIFANAKANTQHAQFDPVSNMTEPEYEDVITGQLIDYSLTQAEFDLIFETGGFIEEIESRKLNLMFNDFLNSPLLTAWIREIRNQAELIYEQKKIEHVEELIDTSRDIYDLSWLFDTPIDVQTLYGTVSFQKNLQISPFTQAWMGIILDDANPHNYNEVKQKFHDIIKQLTNSIEDSGTNENIFEQASNTNTKSVLEELSQLGNDMGFFITTEENKEPQLTEIFSNLSKPNTGFFNSLRFDANKLCDILIQPRSGCSDSLSRLKTQLYEHKYQEIYRTNELNDSRLLDKKFSPNEDKNIYEIIYELCTSKTPRWTDCTDEVSEVVNEALIKQENKTKDELNKLVQEDDIDNTIQIVKSSGIISVLNNQSPNQLNFHLARMNENMDLGNTDIILNKVVDNIHKTTGLMTLAWLLRLAGGPIAKKGLSLGVTTFIESFWISAQPVVMGHFIATLPITIAQTIRSRSLINNESSPMHNMRESLYYSTLTSNEMMNLLTLELSETKYKKAKFENNVQIAATGAIALIFAPAIIGSLTGLKIFEPVLNKTSKLIFGAKEKKINEALRSLGINPEGFDWNIAKLKTMSGLSSTQTKAIKTIERFHNTYHRSFINHTRVLAPIKERYGILPYETHPELIKQEIRRVAQSISHKRAELRALERSLLNKHIILRQRAKNSLLMKNLLNKLQKMRLGEVNGKIVEVSPPISSQHIRRTITRHNLTINGKKINVIGS